MKRAGTILFLWAIALTCVTFAEGAEEGSPENPALFRSITTLPMNEEELTSRFIENREGDGIGEELPSSILYSKRKSKEFGTSMTITDQGLCTRPAEKKICRDFAKMITSAPALGTDITETRIGGADFRTYFLQRVEGIRFEGVDSQIAFLAADSQDPPLSEVVLYIYAKKGTNLIQLNTKVERCAFIPEKPLDDVSYYKKYCVNETIRAKAKERAKELTRLFALKTGGQEPSSSKPERISFAKGRSGAEVKGSVSGYDFKDYILRAQKNQTMKLGLSSKNIYAVFRIVSVNGTPNEELMPSEGQEFTGSLPETGEYVVRVLMMRTGARKKNTKADYTLKVEIR